MRLSYGTNKYIRKQEQTNIFYQVKDRISSNGSILVIFLFAISGYVVMNMKEDNSQNNELIPSPSALESTFPSPSLTPTSIPTSFIVTKQPVSPTNSITKIFVRISDTSSTISDEAIELTVKNNNTGHEQKIRNKNSSWTILSPSPGKYRISVTYLNDRFLNIERSCEGCQNKQDISNYGTCGYVTDIRAGDSINIFCKFLTNRPLVTQSPDKPKDTSPPTTNVYYPQPNGSITYKIDGKVCAIATAPSDDSSPSEVETEYKFDEGNWSGYTSNRGYLCADTLSNGPHTLSYHSKDKAGNIESTKSLGFTVNIEGN